nr:sigma-70 family RNA polymerase sigma factor [Prolixibacteraceae bacterium]
DKKTIKSLLFKIANDFFISKYRKEKVEFAFFMNFKPDEHDLSPDDEVNYKELLKAYDKSLKTMPEKQRVVFLMSRVDELKYKEIADQLELSVKAVEKRMSLALEHLKKNLKGHTNSMILLIISHNSKNFR